MNAQNQIQTFSFNNEALQVINKDGNAWFVASEIAALFGYRDAANLTRLLDDDEADTHIMSIRSENGVTQNRAVSIINESGFYHAAFKSRKPEVKPFRKWVTNEVLPTIRKTGSYQIPTKAIAPKKSKTVPGGLTLEQVEQIQAMHKMLVGSVEKTRQGALAVTLWSAIKAKFGCNYKEIPPEYFLDVLSLMSRTAAVKNAQWQQTGAPELKFNDCGIGKALFNLGRGELSGGDVETALYDMAQIQSAIAWMNYVAYSECAATDSQLENLNYASNALNNLSAMLMEAAAETLKH